MKNREDLREFDASPVVGASIAKAVGLGALIFEAGNLASIGLTTLKSSISPRPIPLEDMPSVEIILPGGEGMEYALRTLLSQPLIKDNRSGMEVVVCDVYKEDNSAFVVQQLQREFETRTGKVRLTSVPPGSGRLSQFSASIDRSEKDIVALASPSMRYSRFWLHNLLSHLSGNIVAVNGACVTPSGLLLGSGYANLLRVFSPTLVLGNCIIRKSAYENSQRFNMT